MFNGVKTTEFILTALVVVGAVLTEVTSVNVLPPQYATLAASIAAGAYAIARGIKKGMTGTGI